MLHIAICDDEIHMLGKLKKMVHDFFKVHKIDITVAAFTCGEKLLEYGKKIDILFLDIQMKNMDGIETAKILRKSGFSGFLIFVTILKETVFQAFEVQAFDYLIKPVEDYHFNKIMQRLLEHIENAKEKNLLIRIGYENMLIPFDDIVFCEVIGRKIYLHLLSGEVIDYYEKLENLEIKLGRYFYKCHRSYLINMKYLRSYKNGMAVMSTGKNIPVSRLRAKEFSEVILQYMKEWGK